MKLLCTGLSGKIGAAFVELYHQDFDEIFYLRSSSNKQYSADFGVIDLGILGSSLSPTQLAAVRDSNVFVNFGALTSLEDCENSMEEALNCNAYKTLDILDNLDSTATAIFIGTVGQYGLVSSGILEEGVTSDEPISVYDLSKVVGEELWLYKGRRRGFNSISLRLSNVFGSLQNTPSQHRGVFDFLLNRFFDGFDISLYGDGKFIRDYIHIDDVCAAIRFSILHARQMNGRVAIVNSGESRTMYEAFEIAEKIYLKSGKKGGRIRRTSKIDETYPINNRTYVIKSYLLKGLGWSPRCSFQGYIERKINAG